MNSDRVHAFINSLGGKVTATTSTWVTCTCLFAKWKHNGGVDNNPSSGMTIKESEDSHYNCFTCGEQGGSYEVYKKIKHFASGKEYPNIKLRDALAIVSLDEDEDMGITFPDYEVEVAKKNKPLTPFDEGWYKAYLTAYKHPYTKERGISSKVAKEIDIRVDTIYHRLLFPVRTWDGVLAGVHGRSFIKGANPRYYAYAYKEFRNPTVWMGEHHTDLDEPLILVEGQFDYAKVLKHYPNVLAGLTTQMQKGKLKRILNASEIITIFDNGTGGDKGRELITVTFTMIPVTHVLVPSPYRDLGEMPNKKVHKLLSSFLEL
jgi:hypothetical protein